MNEWLIEWMNIWLLPYLGMENLFWWSPHITNFYPNLRGAWYIKSENFLLLLQKGGGSHVVQFVVWNL